MTTGWRAIPVDHALVVRADDDEQRPTSAAMHDPIRVRVMQPSQTVSLRLWFLAETAVPAESKVRLVGFGEAILGRPRTSIAPERRLAATWHPQVFDFDLPRKIRPAGDRYAAVEWIAASSDDPGSEFEVLAAAEVVFAVDDVDKVSIEASPAVVTSLLSERLKLTLTNRGDGPVDLTLGAYAPSNNWPASLGPAPFEGRKEKLSVDFSPQSIQLAPGQRCFAECNVRRRVRWVGHTRSHVFDIAASAASGSATTQGTFRQRAVLPPWLLKAIAIALLVILVVWLLVRLVVAIVDDTPASSKWDRLPPAQISARTNHTVTWVTYERPAREGVGGLVDSVLGRSNLENAVVVWGGETAGPTPLADGEIYSDSDNDWKPLPSLAAAEAREGHTAVWTGEHLVVWGGFTPQNLDAGASNQLEATPYYGAAYDPLSGDWTPLPDSGLSPRIGHTMIWTGDALIVFGGVSPNGQVLGDGGVLRSGSLTTSGAPTEPELGDLTDGVWSLFEDGQLGTFLNAPRAFHAATFDGRYMVVSGGFGPGPGDGSLGPLLADAYTYDVQRNRWATVTNALFASRACHQMVVSDGKVVVLGGLGASDVSDSPSGTPPIDPCALPRTIDRPDPAPTLLELTPPDQEPGNPTFDWSLLTDAPDRLGANFAAASTEAGIGIAVPVDSLDGIVPILYTPGNGVATDRLPSTPELEYRSQIVAAWEPATGRLLVWGGRGGDGPDCPDGQPAQRLSSDEPPECLLADGARIGVG